MPQNVLLPSHNGYAPQPVPDMSAYSDAAAARHNLGMFFLSLMVIFAAAGGWWAWMHRTNPKAQAVKNCRAMQTLDLKGMYATEDSSRNYYQSEADYIKRATAYQNKVPGFKAKLRSMLENMRFTVEEPKYDGLYEATVRVTIQGTFGRISQGEVLRDVNETDELFMRNNNGIWQIYKTRKIYKSKESTINIWNLLRSRDGKLGGK